MSTTVYRYYAYISPRKGFSHGRPSLRERRGRSTERRFGRQNIGRVLRGEPPQPSGDAVDRHLVHHDASSGGASGGRSGTPLVIKLKGGGRRGCER